jgi:hypothetical protein
MSSERQHALFSPSAAYRWLNCTASVKAALAAPPQVSSVYAEEGTKAHALLDMCISNLIWDAEPIGVILGYDADMIRAVNVCLTEVWHRGPGRGVEYKILSEQTVRYSDDLFGRIDIIVEAKGYYTSIIDFKYGVVPVAADSPQLLTYAALYDYTHNVLDMATHYDLVVVQPRDPFTTYPVKIATVAGTVLTAHLNFVLDAMADAYGHRAVYAPSADTCRYCPALTTCHAVNSTVAATLSGNTITQLRDVSKFPDVIPVNPQELARILDVFDLFKVFFKACESQAYQLALSGSHIPGRKLVAGRSSRKWHGKDYDIGVALASQMNANLDDVAPRTLKGVVEIEALYVAARTKNGSGRNAVAQAKKEFAEYTTKSPAEGYTLVSASDPRTPADPRVDGTSNIVFIPQTT